jgi:hypothetical protein
MKEPTKADLAAAVATLTAENAGLRDLLAAVSLAADTVPVANNPSFIDEWKRSTKVLSAIKILCRLDEYPGSGHLAYAAEELRAVAAEPVGYEVYTEPPVIPPAERDCPEVNPDGSGEHCYRGGDHGVHRDSNGGEWRTDLGERDPSFISGSPFCTERDFTGTLCELPLGHGGDHRAPGDAEGDPDVTWSDVPTSVAS